MTNLPMLAVLVASCGGAASQIELRGTRTVPGSTGAMMGKVVDVQTGIPLLLVTVVATGPEMRTGFTDSGGTFVFRGLAPGHYDLEIEYGDLHVDRGIAVETGTEVTLAASVDLTTADDSTRDQPGRTKSCGTLPK